MPEAATTPTTTDWNDALVMLTVAVLGKVEPGPELEAILATIRWMRNNQTEARILIGDLTRGY